MVQGRTLAVAAVGAMLLLSACGGGSTSSTGRENPAAGGIDIGTVKEVPLPSGFPSDFPIPDRTKSVYSSTSDGTIRVWFASAQTAAQLNEFFHGASGTTAWKVTYERSVDSPTGQYHYFSLTSGGWKAGVYIGRGGQGADEYTDAYSFWVDLAQA